MKTLFKAVFLVVLLWIFILFSFRVVAQNEHEIDSMVKIIQHGPQDTNMVNCLQRLCFVFKSSDTALSFDYGRKAVVLAEKLGYKRGLALALSNIGTTHAIAGDYAKAVHFFESSYEISEKMDIKYNSASVMNNLGIIYLNQGDYQRALKSFLNALSLYEILNAQLQIDRCLNNIGTLYYYTEDFDLSMKYHFRSLEMKDKLGDNIGKAVSLCNIAIIYKQREIYDTAMYYHQMALDLHIKESNKRGIANSYQNIGSLNAAMGKYNEAEKNFINALELFKEIGNLAEVGSVYNNLGSIYQEMGQFHIAKDYYEKALKEADKNNMMEWKRLANSGLSEAYFSLGEYKKAYLAHVAFKDLADSMLNKDNIQKITQMEMQHCFEQQHRRDSLSRAEEERITQLEREQEEIVRQEELKRQKVYTFAGIIVVLLLLGITFILIRRNKDNQKANAVISLQKCEVEKQKQLVEEKNMEITDSINYSKRIQSALLVTEIDFIKTIPNSFILYIPKDILSGDFYWMEIVEEKVLFAVSDCTGHGVPGALMSIIGINSLNRSIKEFKLRNPNAILDKLSVLVEEAFEKSANDISDGMDIALCSIDYKNLKLEYAGANNSIYILNSESGTLTEIKADKQPIGQYTHRTPFTNIEVDLNPGDILYLFSDGYADQFGGDPKKYPEGKKLKYKQFKKIMIDNHKLSMPEQKQNLIKNFDEWKGDFEQLDDICIIGVKV